MKIGFDVKNAPWTAIWETTQACDIACCEHGDCVQPEPDPLELTTEEAEQLICQVAELQPRIFLLAGADPLKRQDVDHLVRYAALHGLHPAMAVRATPLLTHKAVTRLKRAGLSRLVLTLDGSNTELHDLMCGVHGSFQRTIEATQWAEQERLPFQITTHVDERNLNDLEKLAKLLKPFRPVQWNVVFPVPARRSQIEDMLSPAQFEKVFARLYRLAQSVSYKIKTTEAPHYRRYILQQQAKMRAKGRSGPPQFEEGIPGILPVNEDRATIFISHTGEVYPCASLPIAGGNVRIQKLAEIYRDSLIFQMLHDVEKLKGKCSLCGFKQVCGGSRARALAMMGDALMEDPSCIYRPPEPIAAATGTNPTLPPVQITRDPQD